MRLVSLDVWLEEVKRTVRDGPEREWSTVIVGRVAWKDGWVGTAEKSLGVVSHAACARYAGVRRSGRGRR